jgi:hypothetical protein
MPRTADPRLLSVLIQGVFWWWLVGSWLGFGLVMVFWTVDRAARAAAWVYRRARKAAAGHASALNPSAMDPPFPPAAASSNRRSSRSAPRRSYNQRNWIRSQAVHTSSGGLECLRHGNGCGHFAFSFGGDNRAVTTSIACRAHKQARPPAAAGLNKTVTWRDTGML